MSGAPNCPYCGFFHSAKCALISAIELYADGTAKRVEFFGAKIVEVQGPISREHFETLRVALESKFPAGVVIIEGRRPPEARSTVNIPNQHGETISVDMGRRDG